MKRSMFVYITLALLSIEIAYSIAHLNETHHFFNAVLQDKYYALFAVSYVGFMLLSFWYFVFDMPQFHYKRSMREHFDERYGKERFSIFYTLHFFIFAAVTFYSSAWPYFIMSTISWVYWTWVRSKQNDYADEYELERKKEEAKRKPTVVLDSTD